MTSGTVLVTGAAGFIGPQVVKLLLAETDCRVIGLDSLTYAARKDDRGESLTLRMEISRLGDEAGTRFSFIKMDVCDPTLSDILEAGRVDYIFHLAAESHVDRSIGGAPEFIRTEIQGTHNLLESIVRQNTTRGRHPIKRAVLVGTDEVYGSIDRIACKEGAAWWRLTNGRVTSLPDEEVAELIEMHKFREGHTSLAGGSPYAACKGGADLLALAYFNTFTWTNVGRDEQRFPIIITRGVNNFGPYQQPEKLIPMAICTFLHRNINEYVRRLPIYDGGTAVREWLHTEDHARGIVYVMQKGTPGEVYNVGSGNRLRNRDLLLAIHRECRAVDPALANSELCENVFDASSDKGTARPGHDLCYAVDCGKLTTLGWQPRHVRDLDAEIAQLVGWYRAIVTGGSRSGKARISATSGAGSTERSPTPVFPPSSSMTASVQPDRCMTASSRCADLFMARRRCRITGHA